MYAHLLNGIFIIATISANIPIPTPSTIVSQTGKVTHHGLFITLHNFNVINTMTNKPKKSVPPLGADTLVKPIIKII